MGFRYHKRIKLGKNLGVNISKSGLNPTYRNKKGSIGPKGFSVRTGIPGLTYRKTFSKSRGGCLLGILIFLILSVSFTYNILYGL
ncbi:DUF4236 domain-containing protein [Aestuariivivens sediminis]|uniref:DUF4236 domain-containing protein n=1 Tax=Aestuariivivens sediminis TaxID=2913557 RepID=UPI003B8A925A